MRMASEVWEGEGLPGDQGILQFLHAQGSPDLGAAVLAITRADGPVGASLLALAIAAGLLLDQLRCV